LFVGFFFRRRGKAGLVGAAMTFKEGLELMVDPNMNAAAPQGGLLSKSTSLQQGAGGVDLLLHEHQDVQLGPGGDPEAAVGGTTGTPGSSTTGKSVRPLQVSRDTVHRVGQGRSSLESESESESSQLFGQLKSGLSLGGLRILTLHKNNSICNFLNSPSSQSLNIVVVSNAYWNSCFFLHHGLVAAAV
jgi:hypothetical protein